MIVILKRGPLPAKQWKDSTKERAMQRAQALADLHSCNYEINGDVVTVDSSAYYSN